MVKLYSCLIGMAASRPSESRQLLAKEAMKSATLEPCATFILQHWDSASFTFDAVGTMSKRHCPGATCYDMHFCARVCELDRGDVCPVAPTNNAIGIDVCANGLYCAVKKQGDVFGTCQLIAADWSYDDDYWAVLEE